MVPLTIHDSDSIGTLGTGIDSVSEAARLAGIPPSRIRRWMRGYSFISVVTDAPGPHPSGTVNWNRGAKGSDARSVRPARGSGGRTRCGDRARCSHRRSRGMEAIQRAGDWRAALPVFPANTVLEPSAAKTFTFYCTDHRNGAAHFLFEEDRGQADWRRLPESLSVRTDPEIGSVQNLDRIACAFSVTEDSAQQCLGGACLHMPGDLWVKMSDIRSLNIPVIEQAIALGRMTQKQRSEMHHHRHPKERAARKLRR